VDGKQGTLIQAQPAQPHSKETGLAHCARCGNQDEGRGLRSLCRMKSTGGRVVFSVQRPALAQCFDGNIHGGVLYIENADKADQGPDLVSSTPLAESQVKTQSHQYRAHCAVKPVAHPGETCAHLRQAEYPCHQAKP